MSKIVGIVVFILSLFVSCFSAETVTFTGGTLTRNGWSHVQPPPDSLTFNFSFPGANSDVNGGLYNSTGLNYTEVNSNCCFYGKRLVLTDSASGSNNFRQASNPVMVNGTSYNPFYYKGSINFTGSVLVPRYLKKKQTQVLKFPVTTTGFIQGFVTVGDRSSGNFLFNTALNMAGVATITIRSHEDFMENHFDIVSVRYDLIP